MTLNDIEWPYCADVLLVNYSLTHSCVLETRDIYLSAYIMYQSFVGQEIRSVEHGICPIAEFTSP